MAANLLLNASATGPGVVVGGGDHVGTALGTFGGATLTLELLDPDGATYMAIASTALTAAGMYVVDLPSEGVIRMAVSGGAPSALYATIGRA